jgi:hypothetical protein
MFESPKKRTKKKKFALHVSLALRDLLKTSKMMEIIVPS